MKQSQCITKTRKETAQQEVSSNAQLLERAGYVSKLMAGVYSFLPLGLRVLTKIENIVREEMNTLGAQELVMPALQPRENWDITQRWDKVDVLYKLKGAGERDLCLGPTHEEIITPLVGTYINSYKDLPRYVYQIQTKFRNEARPKSGLLRGREFRMKDLYSFHINSEDLDSFYEKAIDAYMRVFKRCGLGDVTYLTYASGGVFSKYSHEFQTVTPYGEDTIYLCSGCKIAINSEIIEDQSSCPQCNNSQLETRKAIEVGNIFKLMTRFSEAFGVKFNDASGQSHDVVMGCYGIGTSRLVGAVVEILHDEKGIVWPQEIAPYMIHLIALGDTHADAEKLYNQLQEQGVSVLYDDRKDIRPGEKFAEADLLGMPYRLVMSPKTREQGVVELKTRSTNHVELIPADHVLSHLAKLV